MINIQHTHTYTEKYTSVYLTNDYISLFTLDMHAILIYVKSHVRSYYSCMEVTRLKVYKINIVMVYS